MAKSKSGSYGKIMGVDYFPHEVRMCDDEAIQILEGQHGLLGYATWLKLLELIYSQGYYANFSKRARTLFIKNRLGGMPEAEFEAILGTCFSEELLDREIFEKYQVLTSYSIQKRYIKIVQKRDVIPCCKEFWLYFFESETLTANKRAMATIKAIKDKMVFVSFSENDAKSAAFEDAVFRQESKGSDAVHPFSDAELQKTEESKSKSKRESKSKSKSESKSKRKSKRESKISLSERVSNTHAQTENDFFIKNNKKENQEDLCMPEQNEIAEYIALTCHSSNEEAVIEANKYLSNRRNNGSRHYPGKDVLCNAKGQITRDWRKDLDEWLSRDAKLIKGVIYGNAKEISSTEDIF